MNPRLGYFERSFLAAFPRAVFGREREAAQRIRRAAHTALARTRVPDRPSAAIVIYTAAVLEAYRLLQERRVTREEALAMLTEAFQRAAGGRWVRLGTRALLYLLGPRRFVERFGSEGARRGFGALFAFEIERAPGRFTQRVTRCGFHALLEEAGAPELTPVFCAWDRLWADELNRARGVRFERPATIAEGASACVFAFELGRG